MFSNSSLHPIHIGLVAEEPVRMLGLVSIFDRVSPEDKLHLLPVAGRIDDVLARETVQYVVVDLHATSGRLEILEAIRRVRPAVRLIVIGPDGDDRLVMDAIVAGARAYLYPTAGPEIVRRAIEVVIGGSIWAPRQLLAKLIDRLLAAHGTCLLNSVPQFTARERQVLELILKASSNREIARKLGIRERTVKSHVSHLMRKTGTASRIDLTLRAVNESLLTGSAPGKSLAAEDGRLVRSK